MKQLFESFRKFHEQEVELEKPSDIEAYRLSGILIIAKRLRRKKVDILSDIRAIEGITTVSVEDQRTTDTLDFSELRIKIDTTPLTVTGVKQVVANIRRQIQGVKGVQSFRIVSRPEAL